MALTKEQIFAAKFERLKRVAVPEWGGEVWVKAMTVGERDAFEAGNRAVKDTGEDPWRDVKSRLVVATACDESGALLFDESDVLRMRNDLLAAPVDRLADVAMDLAGMTKKDAETLAAELKNGQSAASHSA